MKYKFILFILFIIPISVFANVDDIKFIANDIDLEELNFNFAQGTSHNINFVVENESNDTKMITIYVEGDSETSLASNTLFFTNDLKDEYKEQIEQNNDNIILFCSKKNDDDKVKKWCEGNQDVELILQPKESKKVFAIINIDDDADNHNAQIIAKIDDEIVDKINLEYTAPDKNIKAINLQKFILYKESSSIDFKKWFKEGFEKRYNAEIIVKNTGTEDVEYEYCVRIQSLWIKKYVNFCNNAIINYGDTKKHNIKIIVPEFGKINVTSDINFSNSDNQKEKQNSEPIQFILWPIQFIIILTAFICFCVSCVLLYKYVIKNMFGRKKKKKENNKYTKSYIVKDTDNIISIAQSYGVSWKELANVNDIEPPYILISGETINVPVEDDVEESEKIEKEDITLKNVESNLDIKSNKQQKNEIDNISNTDGIVGESISKNVDVNNIGADADTSGDIIKKNKTSDAIESNEPKEKRILYASPKNMLTKSSSEPTTRAIDIDWMREDELLYTEEAHVQEKKIKIKFIIVGILVLITIIGGVWWSVTWFMVRNNQKGISVDNLIKESEKIPKEDKIVNNVDVNVVEDVSNSTNTLASEKLSNDIKLNDDEAPSTKKVENIKVQVLNAGSIAGAAGAVTDKFAQKGYKTLKAQNAQNDYKGVVIYYSKENKDYLDDIAAVISDEYGSQTREESVDVADKYDADFVIVLGA